LRPLIVIVNWLLWARDYAQIVPILDITPLIFMAAILCVAFFKPLPPLCADLSRCRNADAAMTMFFYDPHPDRISLRTNRPIAIPGLHLAGPVAMKWFAYDHKG
jgi:hypothetical protein